MSLQGLALFGNASLGKERTRKLSSGVDNSQYGVTGADAPTVG
jgi:hypothetical protein